MVNPIAYWVVECAECEAEGPPAKTEEQAIRFWNERAPASEEEQK
ncbi:hypothetical protein UA11_04032 [Burkholderia multivorans]|nr:hypothetical protein UA11_04032 [Burkholderia multivorans]